MPTALCDCGQAYPAGVGAACPRCGASLRRTEASAACPCGEVFLGSASWIYREVTCHKCGRASELKTIEEGRLAVVTRAETGAPMPKARWAFLAFLLPLVLILFADDDVEKRIEETAKDHPQVRRLLEMGEDPEEVFEALPGHRINGAWLPRGSALPWVFLALATAAFAGAYRFFVPRGRATWKHLAIVAVFTGTAGILMLFGLQIVAFSGEGGILVLVALMYLLALAPGVGFVGKLVGFTFGVGLLEEGIKAVPLIWRFGSGHSRLDLRGAAAWGIASGLGFGLSEAISYSLDHYNGLSTAGIYLVRFASCVALHGAWAGTSAILLWRWQTEMSGSPGARIWAGFRALIGPMALHGLYDALLFKEHDVLATIVAAASLTWFLWLYGRADRIEAAVPGLAH